MYISRDFASISSACMGNLERPVWTIGRPMAPKKRKVPMRHINIGDLSRGQASRLI